MKRIKINDSNKSYIVRRYIDSTISRMDNEEIYLALKDFLFKEKIEYPNDTLETEIIRYYPDLLEDHFAENIVGKGAEYAKSL